MMSLSHEHSFTQERILSTFMLQQKYYLEVFLKLSMMCFRSWINFPMAA